MAARFSNVRDWLQVGSMVAVISAVLFCLTHVRSRVSLSLFHSKNRSSRSSFFHTSVGRDGRLAQFVVDGVLGHWTAHACTADFILALCSSLFHPRFGVKTTCMKSA